MKFKKLCFLFPLIFSIVLFFSFSFSVSATESSTRDTINSEFVGDCSNYILGSSSVQSLFSSNGYSLSDYNFVTIVQRNYGEFLTFDSSFTIGTYFFPVDSELIQSEDSSGNAVYSLSGNCLYLQDTISISSSGVFSATLGSKIYSGSLSLTFDTSDNLISVNYNTVTKSVHVYNSRYCSFAYIPDLGFGSSLDVDVSFTPDLSGSLDRMIEQNGVIAESDYFSMDIQNNSSTNIQFMFAVVPKGSEVNLSAAFDDLSLGVDISSADGIYYFTSKEWIYSPTLAHGNVLTGKAVTQYYQSSLWHLITSKSSYSRSFKWSQLNIQKDFEYDAVVIAIPTSLDKASRIFKISSEYYLDLSSAQEVYRSSFSVSNPLAYDATDESFGNTSNNGIIDLKNDSLRADGYIDSETGETIIESVDFGENLENAHNWDPPVISKDLTDLSLEDVSSILSQSTSFFNFLATVFSWLPSWFWALILFGLTSLVVIGIVKAIL